MNTIPKTHDEHDHSDSPTTLRYRERINHAADMGLADTDRQVPRLSTSRPL
jgi:hypothetical protein